MGLGERGENLLELHSTRAVFVCWLTAVSPASRTVPGTQWVLSQHLLNGKQNKTKFQELRFPLLPLAAKLRKRPALSYSHVPGTHQRRTTHSVFTRF